MPIPFRQGRSPVEKPGPGSRTCRARMPGKRQAGWPSLLVTFLLATQEKSDSAAGGGRKPAAGEPGCNVAPVHDEHSRAPVFEEVTNDGNPREHPPLIPTFSPAGRRGAAPSDSPLKSRAAARANPKMSQPTGGI